MYRDRDRDRDCDRDRDLDLDHNRGNESLLPERKRLPQTRVRDLERV